MQQEFSAALYQLMTQTRRKEEDNPHGPDSPTTQENENNINTNTVNSNNKDGTTIMNGIPKQIIDDKSNIEKAMKATGNMNGLSLSGKYLSNRKLFCSHKSMRSPCTLSEFSVKL